MLQRPGFGWVGILEKKSTVRRPDTPHAAPSLAEKRRLDIRGGLAVLAPPPSCLPDEQPEQQRSFSAPSEKSVASTDCHPPATPSPGAMIRLKLETYVYTTYNGSILPSTGFTGSGGAGDDSHHNQWPASHQHRCVRSRIAPAWPASPSRQCSRKSAGLFFL